MNPEKAFFAETVSLLKETDLSPYNRVYFGHETCEKRIPFLRDLKEAKKLCISKGLSFSLVTPFCTNSGTKSLQPLLKDLSEKDELIVNDFGVLHFASKACKAKLVCGRLLNKQYRDPKIAGLEKAPKEMLEHLSLSQASNSSFRELLQSFGIERVELDNLLQGIGTSLHGSGFKASLYHPFVFVAATRLCLTANCDKLSHSKKIGIFPCNKECLKYSFKLENEQFKKPLFLFGNALFFENGKIPATLNGIDRLVFTAKEQRLLE